MEDPTVRSVGVLEQMLAEREDGWILGSEFSVADVACASYARTLPHTCACLLI